MAEMEPLDPRRERRPERPLADDETLELDASPLELGTRLDQIAESLLLDETTDRDDPPRKPIGLSEGKTIELESVVDARDSARIEATIVDQESAIEIADRDHRRPIPVAREERTAIDGFVIEILGVGGEAVGETGEAGSESRHGRGRGSEMGVNVPDAAREERPGENARLVDMDDVFGPRIAHGRVQAPAASPKPPRAPPRARSPSSPCWAGS
jgi:hypothetical protein